MKFCRYCGAQLEDNAVCSCAASQAAQPVAPAQPVAAPVQPVAAEPSGPNPFARAFGKIPAFFKSPAAAADDIDFGVAGILTGLFAICTFMYYLFYALGNIIRYRVSAGSYDYIVRSIALPRVGVIFLGAIAVTLILATLYIVPVMLSRLIFAKDASFGKIIGGAFTSFSVYALPFAAGLVLAGFAALISYKLALITVVLFAVYFLIAIIDSISIKTGGITNNIIKVLLVMGILATLIIVGYLIFTAITRNLVNYNVYHISDAIESIL